LKNEGALLPLKRESRVLVTGPAANSRTMLNGAWSRTWQGVDSTFESSAQSTIYSAMKAQWGESVSYALGVTLDAPFKPSPSLDEQLKRCDIVVACVGELPSTEKPGDIDELAISAGQRDLVKYCAAQGKRVVLVVVEGRPRIIHDIVPLCDAILLAYQPGSMGGEAVVNTLAGLNVPAGRLPMTYPAHEQSLLTYDHKHSEQLDTRFGMQAYQPEWPFGFGLSYATFEYSPMRISNEKLGSNDSLVVEVDVRNTSAMAADQTVLLYSHDVVASVTPSVKKLRGFERKRILPGATATYRFIIHPNDLSFVNASGQWVTEAGAFDIMIGDQTKTIQYNP
ncbi:MAG: glycoside hydrolase family 3 C-terminal domain-containing protein, partial [Flavobacteriales bacterium]